MEITVALKNKPFCKIAPMAAVLSCVGCCTTQIPVTMTINGRRANITNSGLTIKPPYQIYPG